MREVHFEKFMRGWANGERVSFQRYGFGGWHFCSVDHRWDEKHNYCFEVRPTSYFLQFGATPECHVHEDRVLLVSLRQSLIYAGREVSEIRTENFYATGREHPHKKWIEFWLANSNIERKNFANSWMSLEGPQFLPEWEFRHAPESVTTYFFVFKKPGRPACSVSSCDIEEIKGKHHAFRDCTCPLDFCTEIQTSRVRIP